MVVWTPSRCVSSFKYLAQFKFKKRVGVVGAVGVALGKSRGSNLISNSSRTNTSPSAGQPFASISGIVTTFVQTFDSKHLGAKTKVPSFKSLAQV